MVNPDSLRKGETAECKSPRERRFRKTFIEAQGSGAKKVFPTSIYQEVVPFTVEICRQLSF
jgi:hypothetical protein